MTTRGDATMDSIEATDDLRAELARVTAERDALAGQFVDMERIWVDIDGEQSFEPTGRWYAFEAILTDEYDETYPDRESAIRAVIDSATERVRLANEEAIDGQP